MVQSNPKRSPPENNRERHADCNSAKQVAREYIPSGRVYVGCVHAGIIRQQEAVA